MTFLGTITPACITEAHASLQGVVMMYCPSEKDSGTSVLLARSSNAGANSIACADANDDNDCLLMFVSQNSLGTDGQTAHVTGGAKGIAIIIEVMYMPCLRHVSNPFLNQGE